MTAGGTQHAPIHGLVDAAGRLVDADRALADLNVRAGGGIGAPVAVPQLAGLVRLVQRLGIVVSRGVYTADGDRDLDLWVRASPRGDGVALAVVGWTETVSRSPFKADAAEIARDLRRGVVDWRWQVDRHLRLTAIDPPRTAAIGQPLTRLFTLQPTATGSLPLIDAMGAGSGFDDQIAWFEGDPARVVRLAGRPIVAGDGGFGGFDGTALFADEAPEPDDPPADTAFGQRLGAALRGPIDRIISKAEAIRVGEGPLRRDYADYADDIATAGRHMLALVDDLVDLQAIERRDYRARDEPIDLADVARRATGLLAVRAGRADVRIEVPGPDVVLPARGEFGRALQILINLIGNAIRHSPKGGTVWIQGERDGDAVRIVVADQGGGIAAEDHERIFGKFERLVPDEGGGTGLGLYISRRLARAMEGDILVDSAIGDGARFMLVLRAQ